MRLSRYFMPVLKEDPKEAQIVSHRLMPVSYTHLRAHET